MGYFRFRRRIELLPGIHLNVGKTGVSVSGGIPGAHVTVGETGTRSTVGLPGTGLSYTHREPPNSAETIPPPLPDVPETPDRNQAKPENLEDVCNLFPDEPESLCVYLCINDMTCGPYSWFQIIVMLADCTITYDHLYFNPSQNTWEPLRQLDLMEMVRVIEIVMALS